MEGALLREQRRLDIATYTAWHTAVFALNGYAGKLKGKSLSDFIGGRSDKPQSEALQNARAIHFFNTLKAKGLPIEVARIPRNEIN